MVGGHSSLALKVVAGARGLTCYILVDLEARFQAGMEPFYNPLAPRLCLPARPSVQKLAQFLSTALPAEDQVFKYVSLWGTF